MTCAVCGQEFSLWARVTGDAADQVCKACERQGEADLEGLVEAAARAPALGGAQARAWLARFDETAGRYRPPGKKLGPLQQRLFAAIVAGVDRKTELEADDVVALSEMTKSHTVEAQPAISEPTARIVRRWTIQSWEQGRAPEVQCQGLLLEKGEVCHWEEPARLYEQRTQRQYAGGYGGVSVRVFRGVRINTGAFRGYPIETACLADQGEGTLHVTNHRLCFTGPAAAVAVPYKKMISVAGLEQGFQVFRVGAKKPTILQVACPELTLQLLGMATPATND